MTDPSYASVTDVADALREKTPLEGAIKPRHVKPAVRAVSSRVRRHAGRHWYDPDASGDVVATAPRTVTDVWHDVPSSPHRQDGQLFSADRGRKYPVTHTGPFVRVPLDYHDVETVDALRVRDTSGGFVDWTAGDTEPTEDDDWYVSVESETGASTLYLRAGTIGPRVDFEQLLRLDLTIGRSPIPSHVRRGVALLAGAQVVIDDELDIGVPDNGQLVSVASKAEEMRREGNRLLDASVPLAIA